MSDFGGKMYKIRFRLGLRPRPHLGSLQRFSTGGAYSAPLTPWLHLRGPTFKVLKGGKEKRRAENGVCPPPPIFTTDRRPWASLTTRLTDVGIWRSVLLTLWHGVNYNVIRRISPSFGVFRRLSPSFGFLNGPLHVCWNRSQSPTTLTADGPQPLVPL